MDPGRIGAVRLEVSRFSSENLDALVDGLHRIDVELPFYGVHNVLGGA